MAKEKKGNGGTNGDSGAPAEAPAGPVPGADGEPAAAPGGIVVQEGEVQEAPPDQQAAPVEEPPSLDIVAVQDRFVARLPALMAARRALADLEAEHESDGETIAAALVEATKAIRTPPVTELGGIKWRAKHDAEKRGGKLRLHEVTEHKPVQLGQR